MEQIARFKPGENVPAYAAPADVTAGRFVRVSATKDARGSYVMQHCGAGARPSGVAERNALGGIKDMRGGFNVVRRGAIARVTSGGPVAAGVDVMSDATGRAVAWVAPNIVAGMSMHAVSGAGEVLEVDLL